MSWTWHLYHDEHRCRTSSTTRVWSSKQAELQHLHRHHKKKRKQQAKLTSYSDRDGLLIYKRLEILSMGVYPVLANVQCSTLVLGKVRECWVTQIRTYFSAPAKLKSWHVLVLGWGLSIEGNLLYREVYKRLGVQRHGWRPGSLWRYVWAQGVTDKHDNWRQELMRRHQGRKMCQLGQISFLHCTSNPKKATPQ